jgi:biotin transport system permease protein
MTAESPESTTVGTGEPILHRLDPRVKLGCQAGIALAAFVHSTPSGLTVVTALVAVGLFAERVSPIRMLRPYVFLAPFLVAGPVFAAVEFGAPWVDLEAAVGPALASYRTLLLLLVGALYVRTTTVRESEAAIQRLVPTKFGRLLGIAVGLVLRFLPLVRQELETTRDAIRARLGDERPLSDRIQRLVTTTLARTFGRADRLSLALRSRCLSWNPTLPRLRFSPVDVPGILLTLALFWWALWPTL